jgi:hypothetical protein
MKDSIIIDDVEYIRKDKVKTYEKAESKNDYPFALVRTYSAGVYFGWIKEEKGDEIIMVDARNIWYWDGACSLMQIANDGVKNPDECKFTQTVTEIKLKGVISVITCSKEAQDKLLSVKIWER